MLKKYILLLLMLSALLSLCGCNIFSGGGESLDINENSAYDSNLKQNKKGEFIFTWLSFMEAAVTPKTDTEASYREYISSCFEGMKSLGVTDCFFQVRPFGDAMYKSSVYPLSKYAGDGSFDVLQCVSSVADEYGIGLHAWVNPYRLSDDTKEKDIIVTPSGKYLNPASDRTLTLILSGARELMKNYNLRGIHIDDYFYPPDMNSADEVQFKQYKEKGGFLSLSQWRRENVSALLQSLYMTVKSYGEDKLFTVSPSGDIDKNINQLYADVALWCSEKGYCDIILPQLYFGFENKHLPFEEVLSRWLRLSGDDGADLVPALALYKAGQEDIYAGETGRDEWQKSSDIISRQVQCLKSQGISSFGLYSASYINFSKTFLSEELNNLKSVI